MLKISIKGVVWRYPGPTGWYFVTAGKETSARLRLSKAKRVAWGYIPTRATVGTTTWSTTLFPSKDGLYLVALKAAIRKKEHIEEGERVTIHCEIHEPN